MTKTDSNPDDATKLRKIAEGKIQAGEAGTHEAPSPEETRRRLHELRVHQIELEMQNEELRRTQEEVNASRARYFDLYDLAPVGYVTLSEKGLILEANLTAATLLGVARGALVKQPFTRFLLKQDQGIYYHHSKHLFETGEPQVCELRMLKKEEKVFWAHLEAAAAQDADGAPVCRVVMSDITGRKRAEEALRVKEWAIESAMNGVAISDMAANLTYVNASFLKMWGYQSVDEVQGRPATEFWEGDEAHRVVHAVQERGGWLGEMTARRRDGTLFPVELSASMVKDAAGESVCMLGWFADITERKRAEEALRESEACYRLLAENSSAVIWTMNLDGEFTYVSPATFRLRGYTADVVKRQPLEEQVTPGSLPIVLDTLNRLFEDGRQGIIGPPRVVEVEQLRKDGSTVWTEISVELVKDKANDSLIILGVTRDITERKQAEEEKAKLKAQLQQAQKMESVGRLAGGVAHDFNNMLGVILGYVEMALEQVNPAQPLHDDLREIRKAAERSADLTRQLLAFARKQTIAPKVLDLNKTIAGMLKMLQRLIGEDIFLNWQPKANLWPVRVDPSQIDQILANLCVNARDAIADIGKITIETGNNTLDEACCSDHPGFVSGEYVRIAISDDGCGMDKETLAHIFEPFFTTKGSGTGLGLATVYGAVKQNNGFIYAYSEPGQGTTFTIYLPRHVDKAEQARTETPAGPIMRGQETILLVEDEPAMLKPTTMTLERQGYTVLAARTPGQAIRLSREHAGEIHLLMTDVVMPEMNGRDLAKNLLSLYPQLKRLFTSGYTANVIAHYGVLDEGIYFIQKPFSLQDLAAKVREVLDSE